MHAPSLSMNSSQHTNMTHSIQLLRVRGASGSQSVDYSRLGQSNVTWPSSRVSCLHFASCSSVDRMQGASSRTHDASSLPRIVPLNMRAFESMNCVCAYVTRDLQFLFSWHQNSRFQFLLLINGVYELAQPNVRMFGLGHTHNKFASSDEWIHDEDGCTCVAKSK